jgi:hypothetical protein
MEDNSKRNYSQQSDTPQNEQEKQIETARLNVDADKRPEKFQDEFIDSDPNRYHKDNFDAGSASTSGEESSYSSPEDERAYDPKNPPEKYIAEENPDAKEESDSNGVKIPDRTPGL